MTKRISNLVLIGWPVNWMGSHPGGAVGEGGIVGGGNGVTTTGVTGTGVMGVSGVAGWQFLVTVQSSAAGGGGGIYCCVVQAGPVQGTGRVGIGLLISDHSWPTGG